MNARPSIFSRIVRPVFEHDGVHAVTGSALMLGLLAMQAPLWMVLVFPLLLYAGCRLIAKPDARPRLPRHLRVHQRSRAFDACRRVTDEIRNQALEAEDQDVRNQVGPIVELIDRSLGVLREEGRQNESGQFLHLAQMTHELLGAYVRLVRRGLGSREEKDQLCEDLAALQRALEHLWHQINRDVIVELRTLSDMVELQVGLGGK